MPDSFDSVDVAFPHLSVPASIDSIITPSLFLPRPAFLDSVGPRSGSFISIIASFTRLFRLSFLVSPFQLQSTPSSLLPLVAFDTSPFVPTVPAFIHLFHLTFHRLRRHGFPPLPLSLLRSSFFASLGNAFSLLVRTFTSFLLPHFFSHSIPASEVPT